MAGKGRAGSIGGWIAIPLVLWRRRAHSDAMTLLPLVPQFESREGRPGKGWLVHASWSSGRTADIPGFATEAEADAWIRSESPAWLAARLTGSRD